MPFLFDKEAEIRMHKTAIYKTDHRPNQAQIRRSGRSFHLSLRQILILCSAAFLLFMTVWISMVLIGHALIDERKLAAYRHPDSMPVQGMDAPIPRDYVHLNEIPDYLRNAFVAIEDHRFENHIGIDPIALARSLWVDLVQGHKAQGGSTITMQLARNMFLTNEKTFDRKWKEMLISVYLEQRFSKDEILEMYLNNIYFGHGIYGIEGAASYYFNKTVRYGSNDKPLINLSEAAILASLPKAPESYSPVRNWDKAKARQQLVLRRMNDLGYISQDQRESAIGQQVFIKPAS